MRRLPSLNGLRAFEAASRLGSFTAAAAELNVTQAAVSRMVRLLEARLGFALFERRANGLVPTAQGAAYGPGLTAAFDALARLTAEVAALRSDPVLTVATGPTFAMRWLVPRLVRFQAVWSGIEVRLVTMIGNPARPFELRDDWAAAIRLGDGDWPGLVAHPLFSSELFPVCTPAVAHGLVAPAGLRDRALLRVAHSPEDWPLWLKAAGEPGVDCRHGPRFDYYALALQAALDGLGVAIGLTPYVVDDLAAGRLVTPFPVRVPKRRAWYLVHRPDAAPPALAAFRDWLLAEARTPGRGLGA
ncbi:MAG TPA: LysR substrate-binding domain-containing protein [Arenibaculum sp.]|nr:LysR substrate-binding domain-containing protein [Arenibaculum sp.]